MYKLTKNTSIKRLIDGAMIPPDPMNTDYAEFLAWVAKGNTPDPVDLPDPSILQAMNYSAVKQHKINKLLNQGKVSEAIKLKGGL